MLNIVCDIIVNIGVRGVAERDIEFLGVMGWGLMLAENSSVAAAVVAVAVPRS